MLFTFILHYILTSRCNGVHARWPLLIPVVQHGINQDTHFHVCDSHIAASSMFTKRYLKHGDKSHSFYITSLTQVNIRIAPWSQDHNLLTQAQQMYTSHNYIHGQFLGTSALAVCTLNPKEWLGTELLNAGSLSSCHWFNTDITQQSQHSLHLHRESKKTRH